MFSFSEMKQKVGKKKALGKYIAIQSFKDNKHQELFQGKILPLVEKYKNYKFLQQKYYEISFPHEKCFTLDYLYQGILSKYFEIDQLTLLKISQSLINHFNLLIISDICHGKIDMKNIIIELSDCSNKLTVFNDKLSIENIYFIRYKKEELLHLDLDKENIYRIIRLLVPFLFENWEIQTKNETKEIQEKINSQIISLQSQKIYSWLKKPKQIISPRWRYGASCQDSLEEIFVQIENEPCFDNSLDKSIDFMPEILPKIINCLKQQIIEAATQKRMAEISAWLMSSSYKWFTWNPQDSIQLINKGICNIKEFVQKLTNKKLNELFKQQFQYINNEYQNIFKIEIQLEQDKLIDHFLSVMITSIDDECVIEKNIEDIFKKAIKEAYEEEFKLAILKLINELV